MIRSAATRGLARALGRALHIAPRGVHAGLVLGFVLGLLPGPDAFAFVPNADRTLKAIARVNRDSGRTMAIQLELTMRVGNHEPVAAGELISHPSGLARLELRGYEGRVDRYLLSGRELLGARDGRRLRSPQPLLQPLFLLQSDTQATLRAALETFGVQSEWIGLATCGEQDCFVIGDPRLAVPLPPPPAPEDPSGEGQDGLGDSLDSLGSESGSELDEDGLSDGDRLSGPILALPENGLIPRFWVDTRELQVRRIDRSSGVFTVFGPIIRFEDLEVPAWFEIHDPGAQTIRFDVDRAIRVNAPPQAFSRKWLLAPVVPATDAGRGPTTVLDSGAGAEEELAPRRTR